MMLLDEVEDAKNYNKKVEILKFGLFFLVLFKLVVTVHSKFNSSIRIPFL